MRAELKRLHSPDADLKRLETEGDFAILVQAMIGSEGGTGEESFDFVVCSPGWLHMRYLEGNGPIFGAGHMVANTFKYAEIESRLAELCRSTSGNDWQEIASKLSRFGAWEFADYRSA